MTTIPSITTTITSLPTAPNSGQDTDTFNTNADAMIGALDPMVTEENAFGTEVNAVVTATNIVSAEVEVNAAIASSSASSAIALDSTNATSSTSATIGTGSKSFSIQTGKNFVAGMHITIVDDANPSTNTMDGRITSYSSGTGALVVNVTSTSGSGTISAWTITISGQSGTSNIELDTSPTLGGNLDVGVSSIVSTSNRDISLDPNGTGEVVISKPLNPNSTYIGSNKGANISSASPLIIGVDGDYTNITGTTSFNTINVTPDRIFRTKFGGILTLTNNPGIMDLPGGANITTSAGDVATWFSTGTNIVQCVNYQKVNGRAVIEIVEIESGTAMLFYQNSAPTGWTIDASNNDKLIKVVSSSGGVSGGNTAFTNVFNHTHTDTFAADAHTLTTSQIPSHNHNLTGSTFNNATNGFGSHSVSAVGGGLMGLTLADGSSLATSHIQATGSGASHPHNLSGSITSTTIDPQFISTIVATKD